MFDDDPNDDSANVEKTRMSGYMQGQDIRTDDMRDCFCVLVHELGGGAVNEVKILGPEKTESGAGVLAQDAMNAGALTAVIVKASYFMRRM